jgi:hypothetical protein
LDASGLYAAAYGILFPQNIHSKRVTDKIFILNELMRLMTKALTVSGLFLISSSIRADGKNPLRQLLEI